MSSSNGQRFFEGVGLGALGSFFVIGSALYVLRQNELVTFYDGALSDPHRWFAWVYDNLGSSLPVFGGLLIAYVTSLSRLRQRLEGNGAIEKIVQLDQLTDTWTTLFFGTGVIWTAIGMRSALIFALGEPSETAQDGALAVLQRLVDGGILLALSTTIFGGIGGYLMRVYKFVALGAKLQERYDRAARVDTTRMNAALNRIEAHLRKRYRPLPEHDT